MEITIWAMMDKDSGLYEHNHISNGFEDNRSPPKPIGEYQTRAWAKAYWRKTKGILVKGKVKIHPDYICEFIRG